jgi:phosphoribosylformimino-5-aminoimidazole carboxamide ribotide isomerase
MELIPAIDLRGGRCVRLRRGDFAAETVYAEDPLEVLERYRALGARSVHVVDLDGARDGARANAAAVARLLAQRDVAFQVGGGVRTVEAARALLDAGAVRVVAGSVAATAPEEVRGWAAEVGAERITLAFDVRVDAEGTPWVATHGWQRATGVRLWDGLEAFARAGFEHVLCTDVERDGMLSGPNVALYVEALRRYPSLRWQASGGIARIRDLERLDECGAAAAICGRALIERRLAVEELQPYWPGASSPAST